MLKRPPKDPKLLDRIRSALLSGQYLLSDHARQRMQQRRVTRKELLRVLAFGWHENAKDRYAEQEEAWNYAIRGRTLEGRGLRVIVAVNESLLVITVIDLDAKERHGN